MDKSCAGQSDAADRRQSVDHRELLHRHAEPADRLRAGQLLHRFGHQHVGYNAIGNVTSLTGVGSYGYPASGSSSVRPHAVSAVSGALAASYNYDANGNLASSTGASARTVAWTSFNYVASITQGTTSFTYAYGPEHGRIKQVKTVRAVLQQRLTGSL